MSDLTTTLESLRLRVEMLRAGKRERESGDYAAHLQFMDRRIPLLYKSYCKKIDYKKDCWFWYTA